MMSSSHGYRVVIGKRGLDVFIAGSALVMLFPIWILVAIAIKCDDGGPVLFRQRRIGRRGKPFLIWKFRTMRSTVSGQSTPQITIGLDPRITRVWAWLRRTKLDESIQVINVLAGDMHMVGPRPEVPRYVDPVSRLHRQILAFRPGITDPASLVYRSESDLLSLAGDPECLYVNRLLPDKLRRSRLFAGAETIGSDVRVLMATACGRMVT